jgi:hypothetical protein
MHAFYISLIVVYVGLYLSWSVDAGEVVLYHNKQCHKQSADSFLIFSSDSSTGCVNANSLPGNPIYAVSTSRNMGRSCTFSFFHDHKCQQPAGKLISSGPRQNCHPIKSGVHSYRISCHDPDPDSALALPNHFPESWDSGSYEYYQPHTTYRGKPSGNAWWFTYLYISGGQKEQQASGSARVVGEKLTTAFFQHVPTHARDYRVSTRDAGTQWNLHVGGSTRFNYKAEEVAATIGKASFASMVAYNVATLLKHPETYLYFALGDSDNGKQLGYVNITYS